jgi:hypothetical protein
VNPDPLGLPDAVLMRPSVIAVLDGVKGEVTVVAPAWVLGPLGAGGLCAGGRAGVGRAARSGTRALGRRARDGRCRAAGGAGVELRPCRLSRRGGEGQGLHPRGRHLPGRALAALEPRLPPAALRALPGAPAHQPLALHVLLQLRPLPGGGREPRDPRAGLRRRGHDPPHRGHPQTRGRRRRKTARWRPTCCPTKRNWPST